MHARVTRMALKPGADQAMVDGARRYMAATDDKPEGFLGALLLVSDDGTEAMSVTLWRTREAIEATEAGGGYAAVMKPYETLFSGPYEHRIMKVGSTTLVPGGLDG